MSEHQLTPWSGLVRGVGARACVVLATCVVALPAPASASDDEPIPYSDEVEIEQPERRGAPPTKDPEDRGEAETEKEFRSLASIDDPNLGLGAELLGGVLFVDSVRGAGLLAEPRLAYGARLTWELGRTFSSSPSIRESLLTDFSWLYTSFRDGTPAIFATTNIHTFTAAPAWAIPLGEKSAFAFFLQAGGGLSYLHAPLNALGTQTVVSGVKPVVQYGVGFRGRPALTANEGVRVSFRIELTRLHRGYLADTFLGASAGLAF